MNTRIAINEIMSKITVAIILTVFACGLVAALPQDANATFLLWDDGVNHPEIDWKYTETEHFTIYWYPEIEHTARQLLKVAEDIYEHNATLYNFELKDKVNVVILDTEDYANGFAAYSFNWITIWASHLYYDSRGRVDWVADVFSHELGHIVTLKAAANMRENMYGVLFGFMEGSRKYNFDVGVGVFYGSERLPTWMVEGVAQFTSMTYGADPYDTNREMLVRAAALDDNLLTMDQMDIIYDKNSLQAEMVYNQGFSMNAFIGEQWGLDAPARMWHETGVGFYPVYNRMINKELGVSREELYNQWKAYITDKYSKQVESVLGVSEDKEVKGRFLRIFPSDPPVPETEMSKDDRWILGITNHFVKQSPDGEYLSLVSSHGLAQRRGAKIYFKKLKPDPDKINDFKPEKGPSSFFGGYSWHPDGKQIVFAGHKANPWTGHYYSDLQVYNIETKKTERITHNARAMEPSWSPDGTRIAFITNEDGKRKLCVMRYPKISGHYVLMEFDDDTQLGFPTWSPDGSKITFLMYRKKQQDVWVINSDGTDLQPVTYDKHDNRDPEWLDNENVLLVSDRNGIFNVYSVNINTHTMMQITNVKTGAMWPMLGADGESITYSYFTSYGFRPYEITKDEWLMHPVEDFEFNVTDEEVQLNLTTTDPLPEIVGQDYSVYDGLAGVFPVLHDHAGTWVWIPIVNYEDSRIQLGAQLIMVDAVERNLVFAFWYVGEESRYSLFYENYMTPVTLWCSLHRIFPAVASDFEFFNFDAKISFDVAYYLIGMRYTLFGDNHLTLFYQYFDVRAEQPSLRSRQSTTRSLNFNWTRDSVYRSAVDGGINPRGGSKFQWDFTFASPKISEPFTGAPMGADLSDIWSNPAVTDEEEARANPDEDYLVPDNSFWQTLITYRKYIPFPFWDMAPLNDTWAGVKGWDWANMNFERWKRQRHTLIIKFMGGFTHSDIPEGYGWGNSYGRVGMYDRFNGGGMWVTGTGTFSFNGAFLGYEKYSLSGETMAVMGWEYRYPLMKEMDVQLWAFYFDKMYMSLFGNVGNLWSHPTSREGLYNLNTIFDKNYDGEFNPEDDLISDVGIELRLSMFMFASGWDSFIKIAHGFQDPSREEKPLRYYIGLGTGFDDRY
ncbi:MAG: DPP IV N-terminal domain-containing protein [Candidatus Lernaella stagnicola]|nr:DPP IV N-terminal domain-containing protein [Candidatus Lernaella stagnicola]